MSVNLVPGWIPSQVNEIQQWLLLRYPFPRNQNFQPFYHGLEVRSLLPRQPGHLVSVWLWKVLKQCSRAARAHPPSGLCPGPSLIDNAMSSHFSLKSKIQKPPTLASGPCLRAEIGCKNTLVHSHLRRGSPLVQQCARVSMLISLKLQKLCICPRKCRAKQTSNKICNPKLGVGERH